VVYLGIDNGVTGTWGIIDGKGIPHIFQVPVKNCLNYQKTKVKHLNRIDTNKLTEILTKYLMDFDTRDSAGILRSCKCLIERPMVNPDRFDATVSALRALEATIIVLENLNIPYEYCDSKAWQKKLLPFTNDWKMLKQVSKEIGMRVYPTLDWDKMPDGDGIHIARFCQIFYNQEKEEVKPTKKVEKKGDSLFNEKVV